MRLLEIMALNSVLLGAVNIINYYSTKSELNYEKYMNGKKAACEKAASYRNSDNNPYLIFFDYGSKHAASNYLKNCEVK